ncbi:hypothetical protein [Haloarchaeobius baliensis]|uniref:hypothetical protein n=1 Tax=Haloarchaeobius baliensis TaxID=1670458 RepID=UPI003F881F92
MSEQNDLLLSFGLDRHPLSAADELVAVCRANGFEIAPFDDDTRIEYTIKVDGEDQTRSATSPEDVAADGARDDVSKVEFRCEFDGVECVVVTSEHEAGTFVMDLFAMRFGRTLFDGDGLTRETARARADRLTDFVADAATTFDAWYVTGHRDLQRKKMALGRPPDSDVSELGWLTVFDDSWTEVVGDRQRLLDAPVYETRALDDERVLLRRRDVPADLRDDVDDDGPASLATEYVFEGMTHEEVLTEAGFEARKAELDERTHRDPFRAFDDGEVGSDVLVCQYDAPFDVAEIDYDAFPDEIDREDWCFVLAVRREGDKLYGARNGEFLRRLVDDDGRPIGDLPPDWPPEHELVSMTLDDGLFDLSPGRFYMPDASGEQPSSISRLFGVTAVPEEMSLWEEIEAIHD